MYQKKGRNRVLSAVGEVFTDGCHCLSFLLCFPIIILCHSISRSIGLVGSNEELREHPVLPRVVPVTHHMPIYRKSVEKDDGQDAFSVGSTASLIMRWTCLSLGWMGK